MTYLDTMALRMLNAAQHAVLRCGGTWDEAARRDTEARIRSDLRDVMQPGADLDPGPILDRVSFLRGALHKIGNTGLYDIDHEEDAAALRRRARAALEEDVSGAPPARCSGCGR